MHRNHFKNSSLDITNEEEGAAAAVPSNIVYTIHYCFVCLVELELKIDAHYLRIECWTPTFIQLEWSWIWIIADDSWLWCCWFTLCHLKNTGRKCTWIGNICRWDIVLWLSCATEETEREKHKKNNYENC